LPDKMPTGTVRQLLDSSTLKYEDKVALIFPQSNLSLSYVKLQQRVQEIASGLSLSGLKKGSKIAICLPNGAAFVESFLGALYGGYVAVPFDYLISRESLKVSLQHCDADLLVSDKVDFECGVPIVPAEELSGQIFLEILEALSPDDYALIDYTSGTTDNPKGVLLGHKEFVASVVVHEQMYALTSEDTAFLVMPLHHLNPQGVSLLSTLYTGGTVIIPDKFRLRDFVSLLNRYNCTWAALVPTMIDQLLLFTDNNRRDKLKLNNIRFVRSSSAPLPATTQKKFEQRFSVPVIQAMGSTEAGSTFFSNPLPPKVRKTGSVGLPVGFKARVVDEFGEPLATKEVGAIQILGATLMLGYYLNKESTDKQFSDDGWLFTGDVGFRDIDGYYFVVGRRAEVVNKGGEKISLFEVDSVLMDHIQVIEGAAVAISDELYGQQLVVFVVLQENVLFIESEFLRYFQERLGTLRAPNRVFEIDTLPRTSTMKVKRSELAQIAEAKLLNQSLESRKHLHEEKEVELFGPPLNLTERLVANMFAKVLNIQETEIVRNDNFFILGGTSLDAVRFLHLMGERNIGNIPIKHLSDNPTVQGIAKYIEANIGESFPDSAAIVCLSPGGNQQAPLFLVPGGGGDDNAIFFIYGKLIEHMDVGIPIYAFRAHGVKGESRQLPANLEQISSDYIDEMKRKQPTGPYSIVGFCIGGLVAYEMAQELIRRGDEVASLVIADTRFPGTKRLVDVYKDNAIKIKKKAKMLDSFFGQKLGQRAMFHMKKMKELSAKERAMYFMNKLKRFKAFYIHSTAFYVHTHSDIEVAKKISKAKKHYQQVLEKYEPEPYPGKLIVIVSENLSQREQPWYNINPGRVITYNVPGDHESHVREYAKEVAQALEKSLYDKYDK